MRDLVASDWYQERWGEHVQLVRTSETSFENTAKGSCEDKPFRSLRGGRGDWVLVEDPHSTETAEWEAERQTTTYTLPGIVDPMLSCVCSSSHSTKLELAAFAAPLGEIVA
jgi:hypothetical protein